uniref:Uncharacterized protein n=1 Tax=Chromera velia CCMP2878 TaxID=1169474 RepID=A0A0G4I8X4_9ALVE|eukprot:Cvel_12077.t1-p1 / transcript=Cvel_12077.t1 / gene=Cvel_12077 / organism=Chromera_velia_CCMP2878 / gene_product=hypothetical protein / transcript_product=hypothetical protein / location=Cvel_scaffold777:21255-23070(+) / protein_length=306 / sequence_SO=supercontig / SO=protein_coding / is_pseudo=false
MFGFAEGNGQTPGAASGAQPQGGEGDPPGLFGWAKTDGVANSRAGEPAALQRTSPGGQSAPAEIGMRPAIGQITDQSATSVFHETSNMSPKNKVASQLQRATTNRLSANTGARVDVHIEFTSPRGHPLKYTSQAPPNYPSGAYTCDMCAMTKYFTEGGCWHSSVDQYDLCPQCAALVKHKGITSAPLVPQMGPGAGGGVSPLASRGPPGTGGMGTGFIGSPRTRTFNSLRTPTASPRRTQSASEYEHARRDRHMDRHTRKTFRMRQFPEAQDVLPVSRHGQQRYDQSTAPCWCTQNPAAETWGVQM